MSRPLGSKNKVPLTVRNEIIAVYEELGGRQGMAKWAQKDPATFYRLYCQMAPKEVALSGEVAIKPFEWDT